MRVEPTSPLSTLQAEPQLRKGPIPLYVQLADALRRRVAERYRADDRFPTVAQLGAEFGVALVTVRQALALLEEEGLVSRARGRGTTVLQAPATSGRFHLSTALDDLIESTRDTRPRLLKTALAMPPRDLVPAKGILAPSYRFMHRVHSIADAPYAVLRLYLDDRLYRALPSERFETDTVVCALKTLRPSPIRSGHQHVGIERAAADDASWLQVPPDSPVARIKRYFQDRKGTLIYLGDVVYRGDFVSWEMDLDV